MDDSRPGNAHGRARSARTWAALVPALMMVSAVLAGCDGQGSAGSAASSGSDASDASDASGGPAGAGTDSFRPIPDRLPGPSEQTADTGLAGDLRAALERLVAGESPPEAGAASSSAEKEGALRSVTVDPAGHATVDFRDLRPLIPNALSSAGSTALLRELNATVFGVDGIRSVEYRMEGSCDLFWEWLQYECRTVTRADSGARGA